MAQMKEDMKAPNIELSNEEIANLSDAEFKTLIIRMLTEMVEYGCKIEEKMKAIKREIKENAQGMDSDRKETGTQNNGLEQKEEIPYFLDYKMHPPQIWEENGGASYSPNVAYLAGGRWQWSGVFPSIFLL